MTPFHIDVQREDHGVVLVASGELDLSSSAELTSRVEEVLTMVQGGQLVIDISGVTFMDSTGLTSLLIAQRACTARAVQLVVRAPSPAAARTLEMAGVEQALTIEWR